MSKFIRVLTVADLHQSRRHYRWLASAVAEHKPDLITLVGDCLGLELPATLADHLSVEETAEALSGLPAQHLLFVRGNHEQEDWQRFVAAWPFDRRPLVALYGSAFTLGPLVIVGFPCKVGWEGPWCQTLYKHGNGVVPDPAHSGRKVLPVDPAGWLPRLMRQTGSAGRTLWLMHEPPVARPIASPATYNPDWTDAVERFRPLLTVSGHDHHTPLEHGTWHTKLGDTVCVNVGQDATDLHYGLIEFEFRQEQPCLPTRVIVRAFPWNQRTEIRMAEPA